MMLKTKHYLTDAVKKRMMSERPVSCLLGGGFSWWFNNSFSIEILYESSTTNFSRFGRFRRFKIWRMADFLGTHHHEVVVTEKDMNFIETDIVQIESYDTTTVRASVPMLMLCKYVRENTDVEVFGQVEGE